MIDRFFRAWISHRLVATLVVLGLTLGLGAFAGRVRPDYSIEHVFPVWDSARQVYDRFKASFPYEDARAIVIVEAPDLFTGPGMARMERIETRLRSLEGVIEVEGPRSARDIVARGEDVAVEPLFPAGTLTPEQLAHGRATATTDPLFAWSLAKPDGSACTIRITLTPKLASTDEGRMAFTHQAQKLLADEAAPGQKIILSGLPVIRTRFAEMIGADLGKLVPLALLGVLVLLFVSFRSVGSVVASLVTMVVALIWTFGAMGLGGFPITMVSSILPIVVIIISVSDTVHIVNDFAAHRREGKTVPDALVEAMSETCVPCLLTEIVLACGFLSLVAVNIRAVFQFGLAAAAAMLLTWLANMTVLPLLLSVLSGRSTRKASPEAPWAVQMFARRVDWIGRQVIDHPRRIAVIALLIFCGAGFLALRVRQLAYVFDGLRPSSALAQELKAAEAAHGGLVPLVIYYEGTQDGAALDPEVLRSVDRAAALLRSFPEIKQASSLADYVRKTHHVLAGEGDLPTSRALITQEVSTFDDGKMLRDFLSIDRRSAAAVGYVLDAGSIRFGEMFQRINAFVAAEQTRLGARVRVSTTGQLRIFQDVNEMLVGGLLGSFAGAVLVSILVFCLVLRSFRLGLIGLIPNVAPIVLVLAFMSLAGIALKPSVVMAFSITLVIADDDTIQYLARFRGHFVRAVTAGATDPYRTAALDCLREVGLPMFITSTSVSLGFLLLCTSSFQASADLGMLIGATLFAAVFADLFLAPLLLIRLRPNLGVQMPTTMRDAAVSSSRPSG
jgi:predicted RND superfamily exporter protein